MKDYYSQLKVIELGLAKENVSDIVSNPMNFHATGVDFLLLEEKELDIKNKTLLGFDVLGFELGYFTSYIDNGFERDFVRDIGLKINQFGLMNSYDDALQGTNFILKRDSGAEDLVWKPWAIYQV